MLIEQQLYFKDVILLLGLCVVIKPSRTCSNLHDTVTPRDESSVYRTLICNLKFPLFFLQFLHFCT